MFSLPVENCDILAPSKEIGGGNEGLQDILPSVLTLTSFG